LPHADVDTGRATPQIGQQWRQEHGGGGIGAPSVNLRVDVAGSNGPPHRPRCEHAQHWHRCRQLRCARGRYHTLGCLQKQGSVEQAAQAAKPVTDCRRRQVQAVGGPAHVLLVQHRLEQHEEVEIGP
jgi:hypothetical protein